MMFNQLRFCPFLLFMSTVGAFLSNVPSSVNNMMHTSLNLMSSQETQRLIDQATECAEGECSLDQVDDLIQILQSQQRDLHERLTKVKTMVKSLQIVNGKDNRDEVRETVRALHRVFQLGARASGNDYPSLSKPTGWSGEVGDGPMSAYDALPPKKWSKSID